MLVTIGYGLFAGLSGAEFLLDTFVDDYVGIHRHTDGQDDTGKSRQGQRSTQRSQYTEDEQDIDKQSDVGVETRTVVEEDHPSQHRDKGDDERNHARFDRFTTQRRSDYLRLNDVRRSRQTAGLKDVGQILCFLDVKLTGDLGTSAGDSTLHGRSGINRSVKHDGNGFADVVARKFGPTVGTGSIHDHVDTRPATLVIALGRIADHVTGKDGLALGIGTDGIEFHHRLVLYRRLVAPHELNMLHSMTDEQVRSRSEIFVDYRRILDGNISDDGYSLLNRIEHIEERIFPTANRISAGLGNGLIGLLEQFLCGSLQRIGIPFGDLVSFGRLGQQVLCRVFPSYLFCRSFFLLNLGVEIIDFFQTGIEIDQKRSDLLRSINGPEFQRGRRLKELAHTLGIGHTGQFHRNLVGAGQTLDRGRRYAELVDTGTKDLIGAIDSPVHFLADDFLYLVIGQFCSAGSRSQTAEDLRRGERYSAAIGFGDLVELAEKYGNEILFASALLPGSDQSLVKGRIGRIVGQAFDHILDRYLQDDAHAALQVEAQLELIVLDLRISILDRTPRTDPEVDHRVARRRIEIVLPHLFHGRIPSRSGGIIHLVRLCDGILLGNPIDAFGLPCKKQLVHAYDPQNNEEQANGAFVLHYLWFCL